MGIAFSYGYTMEKDPKTLMPRYVCVWVPGRIEFGRPRCQDESRFECLSKQSLQPFVYSVFSGSPFDIKNCRFPPLLSQKRGVQKNRTPRDTASWPKMANLKEAR